MQSEAISPRPRTDLTGLRHFLLDMDGTVYLGPNLLEGAAEFVDYLKSSGRRFLFFTNNSSHDADEYRVKLDGLGIRVRRNDILTSGEATIRYLLTQTPHRRVYVVGMPSFEEEARAAGLELTDNRPDAVVLAFDRSLTYEKLKKASLFLAAGLPYYATNPDKVCPTEYGYIPDCAAMAALLETATGRMPHYIGKPNPDMARLGMEKIGGTADTTVMVGDRLYTDMAMARAAGIRGALVLSGEATAATLSESAERPDYVFPHLGGFLAALREADGA